MPEMNAGPSPSDIFKNGNTAVITGASSGIGKAASAMCASRGMNVWMADVDESELDAARDAVREAAASSDQRIEASVVDVSSLEAMEKLRDKVFSDGGKCHFLMNNAGTGAGGGPLTSMDVVHQVMGVNAYGPMHGCLAFVPRMKEMAPEPGLIVNTGSKQGITMPPGNLTYNVSKAALKCYTEGLEHELRTERAEGTSNLRAALLVPGWVNTSIVLKLQREKAKERGEDFDEDSVFFHEGKPAAGAWMPSQVVDYMIEELGKGRFYVICPDNDVDRETDNLRMTWTMQDITEDRPPLSRWHPDYKERFSEFLARNKSDEP